MVLISKTAMVRWNGFTRKHYESFGYKWTKQNDYFEVKIDHLMKTSTVKVEVKCDYCGEVHLKEYRDYFDSRKLIQKDSCSNRKCMVAKSEEVSLIKYGVKSYAQTEQSKKYLREKFQTPKDEVLKFANNKGLTILNIDDYENEKTRLKVKCNNHPELDIFETNFNNIRSQTHCCRIGGDESVGNFKRLDGNVVVEAFKEKGFIPLFSAEDYQNNMQPLPYKCPKHPKEVQYRTYANLEYCDGCYKCAKERTGEKLMNNQEDIFDYFNSRGLIVEEGEVYKGKDIHIACRCVHHPEHIQYKAYHPLMNTDEPCIYCRNEKSLTELNRLLRSTIISWRKKSEENCNYKCILTGSDEYEVHHLYSFNSIIKDCLKELNIDIGNYTAEDIIDIKKLCIIKHDELLGVCIRPDLHILFHQMFSKDNNTSEQFEEFKELYFSGKLNNKLNII